MAKSLNMNYVNCALLVVVLVLVIMCCMNKSKEGLKQKKFKNTNFAKIFSKYTPVGQAVGLLREA